MADTQGKCARLSCSLDAAHAHPLFSCRQSFISGSRTSDTIHHLKYLICNLEQITSYGWLVLTTIFRWLILTVFDSNDCKQILSGGESIIPRCSLQGFWFKDVGCHSVAPSEWAMPRSCCVKPWSAWGSETWKWYKERPCAHHAPATDELWQTYSPTLPGHTLLDSPSYEERERKKRSFLLATPAPMACSSLVQKR